MKRMTIRELLRLSEAFVAHFLLTALIKVVVIRDR